MTPEQLQEGARLLAAATPGWTHVSHRQRKANAAAIAWLRTHAAELIADAGRYQWLRAECVSAEENESPAELIEHCWVDAKIRTEQDVDAAIDAARASGTEGACS